MTKKIAGWTLAELLKLRDDYARAGMVGNLMSINGLLARYAKKYKLDYYSLK